jgi:hypothetical protein
MTDKERIVEALYIVETGGKPIPDIPFRWKEVAEVLAAELSKYRSAGPDDELVKEAIAEAEGWMTSDGAFRVGKVLATALRAAWVRISHTTQVLGEIGIDWSKRAESAERNLAEQEKEIAELRREVREWYCVDCRTVYPGPPQEGVKCVICPRCGGRTCHFQGDTPIWKLRAEQAERLLASHKDVIQKKDGALADMLNQYEDFMAYLNRPSDTELARIGYAALAIKPETTGE